MRTHASISNDKRTMFCVVQKYPATSLWLAVGQGWNMKDSGPAFRKYMSVHMMEHLTLQEVLPRILHKLTNRPPESQATSMGLGPPFANNHFFMPSLTHPPFFADMMERELGYPQSAWYRHHHHRLSNPSNLGELPVEQANPFETLVACYTRWLEHAVQLRAQHPAQIQALLPALLKVSNKHKKKNSLLLKTINNHA